MKAANKIIRDRKLRDEEKIARLGTECGIPADGARKLLQPDFAGRIGFANYELTNNAANIRRMQARAASLAKESARPSVVVAFPGGRMEDNAEDCRVRIYHDEKPAADVIQKLKANGFYWSPSNKAWQRSQKRQCPLGGHASDRRGLAGTGHATIDDEPSHRQNPAPIVRTVPAPVIRPGIRA